MYASLKEDHKNEIQKLKEAKLNEVKNLKLKVKELENYKTFVED